MNTPHDPDALVALTSARTEFEAETLAEALRAAGIRAEVFATATSALQWEAGYTDPIKVMVRREDLEAAAAVKASLKKDSVDIDWDEVEGAGGGEGGERGGLGGLGGSVRGPSGRLKLVWRIGWGLLIAGFLTVPVANTLWAGDSETRLVSGLVLLGLSLAIGWVVWAAWRGGRKA